MVHLQALPSAGGSAASFSQVVEAALADAKALVEGGVDGLMVENFGDAPFRKGNAAEPVDPDVPAALAVVARELWSRHGLPVGINCLRNDGYAALGAAAIADARWVRVNVLCGSYVTDQGLVDGEAARLRDYRQRLSSDTIILADLLVKHAAPLVPVDPLAAALDLAERSGAGGLILSGARTGEPVDLDLLLQMKAALGDFPVWIGSGLNLENATQLWPHCDGAIVGTALKRDGRVTAPVDPQRVRALRQALQS